MECDAQTEPTNLNHVYFDLFDSLISSTLDGYADNVETNLRDIELFEKRALLRRQNFPPLSIDMCKIELICNSFRSASTNNKRSPKDFLKIDEDTNNNDQSDCNRSSSSQCSEEQEEDLLFNNLNDTCPPLHSACASGYFKVAKLLVQHGASANKRCLNDERHQTALHYACEGGGLAMCNMLIREGGAHLDARDIHGNTPLHLALGLADAPLALLLINEGAEVNIINGDGQSPLFVALLAGGLGFEVISALLAAGADVNFCNDERAVRVGKDGLLSTTQSKAMKAVKTKNTSKQLDWFLGDDSDQEEDDSVRSVMSHHKEGRSPSGDTCLHLAITAVGRSHRRSAGPPRYFANATEERNSSTSVLDQLTDEDVIFFALLKAGANILARNPANGKTPLHYALENDLLYHNNPLTQKQQRPSTSSYFTNGSVVGSGTHTEPDYVASRRVLGYLTFGVQSESNGLAKYQGVYNYFTRASQEYQGLPLPPSIPEWAGICDKKGMSPYSLILQSIDPVALSVASWVTVAMTQNLGTAAAASQVVGGKL